MRSIKTRIKFKRNQSNEKSRGPVDTRGQGKQTREVTICRSTQLQQRNLLLRKPPQLIFTKKEWKKRCAVKTKETKINTNSCNSRPASVKEVTRCIENHNHH